MRDADGTIDFHGNDLDIALSSGTFSWRAAALSPQATANC